MAAVAVLQEQCLGSSVMWMAEAAAPYRQWPDSLAGKSIGPPQRLTALWKRMAMRVRWWFSPGRDCLELCSVRSANRRGTIRENLR